MAFYIKPSGGVISLGNLQRFGIKRLIFLNEVLNCEGPESFRRLINNLGTAQDSECLIEGSKKDRASHFLLRLVCSEDTEMRNFLLQAETELFCYRFSNMNTTELTHLLRSTHKFVANCLNFDSCRNDEGLSDLFMAFEMIFTSTSSWLTIISNYMNDSNKTFQIPFQLALSLVAGRKVVLQHGLAHVPFSNLHVVLSSLFYSMLRKGLQRAAAITLQYQDERTTDLLHKLRTFCQNMVGKPFDRQSLPGTCIACGQIDEEAKFFPPCMKQFHRVLRDRHRLRHHSRIQYTLFLKEVGLPVSEALNFWQNEYSQPQVYLSGRQVTGGHSWQKDKKRYTYNIRHLYGLEGSKVNYRAHSCRYLQSFIPGPGEEGGCPFSQYDQAHLRTLMDIEDIGQSGQRTIQTLSQNKRYSDACMAFHKQKLFQHYVNCPKVENTSMLEMIENKLFDEREQDDEINYTEETKEYSRKENFGKVLGIALPDDAANCKTVMDINAEFNMSVSGGEGICNTEKDVARRENRKTITKDFAQNVDEKLPGEVGGPSHSLSQCKASFNQESLNIDKRSNVHEITGQTYCNSEKDISRRENTLCAIKVSAIDFKCGLANLSSKIRDSERGVFKRKPVNIDKNFQKRIKTDKVQWYSNVDTLQLSDSGYASFQEYSVRNRLPVGNALDPNAKENITKLGKKGIPDTSCIDSVVVSAKSAEISLAGDKETKPAYDDGLDVDDKTSSSLSTNQQKSIGHVGYHVVQSSTSHSDVKTTSDKNRGDFFLKPQNEKEAKASLAGVSDLICHDVISNEQEVTQLQEPASNCSKEFMVLQLFHKHELGKDFRKPIDFYSSFKAFASDLKNL